MRFITTWELVKTVKLTPSSAATQNGRVSWRQPLTQRHRPPGGCPYTIPFLSIRVRWVC